MVNMDHGGRHHPVEMMELSQIQIQNVECDNRGKNNGGRNILGSGSSRLAPSATGLGLFGGNSSNNKLTNSLALRNNSLFKPNNKSGGPPTANNGQAAQQQQHSGNVHSDYTIAV